MIVDKNGITFLEEGDQIMNDRGQIGIVNSINTFIEQGKTIYYFDVYYPKEKLNYNEYLHTIKYVLTPFKFS